MLRDTWSLSYLVNRTVNHATEHMPVNSHEKVSVIHNMNNNSVGMIFYKRIDPTTQ